ncbi:MAG: preprotein translocase subunit SecA, partial [Erysipelotrichaceae bacterium]|nr:preprotein translocase subunit SecA [Erysipelotrichaceae bacterium]
ALIDEVIKCHEKGQPVLVGTIAVETSEFISKMLKSRKIPHEVLNAKNHLREAEIIKRAGQRGAVTIATNMAGRGTDIKLGEGIRELGGLAVLGSERHESRRIDNQLRGRSGRQGDPGYSRFFVSVQDDLMIRFGSERMEGMFAQLGDVPIESKMITKSIGSAQKRVEGHNFDIRKTLLDYDDVLRQQREIIYEQRDFILENDNVHEIVHDMFNRVISNAVAANTDRTGKSPVVNLDTLIETLEKMGFKDGVTKAQLTEKSEDEITGICADAAWNIYEAKIAPIMMHVLPLEKTMVLKVIDRAWVNHIDIMSKLREGIHLRSYAEGNPLQAYVSEGYALFEDMMARISQEIVNFCLNARVIVQQRPVEAPKEEAAAEETTEVKHKKKKKGKK